MRLIRIAEIQLTVLLRSCGLRYAAVFVLLLLTNIARSELDVESTCDRILQIRNTEAAAINSIEMKYAFQLKIEGLKDKDMELSKQCAYGREGQKIYHLETVNNNRLTEPGYNQLAYDGVFCRQRSSVMIDVMTLSREERRRKLNTPAPSALIGRYEPEKLVKEGLAMAVSAENVKSKGSDCIKVSFELLNHPTVHRLEVWYDAQRGYWPILGRGYDDSGVLVEETSEVKLCKVVVEGNEHYYPTKGQTKLYEDGKICWLEAFEVVEGSLRINQDIPESKFTLEPKPGEIVYDQDLGITLIDPGKMTSIYDLATGFGSPEETSPRPETRRPTSGESRGQHRVKKDFNSINAELPQRQGPTSGLAQHVSRPSGWKVVIVVLVATLLIVLGVFSLKKRTQNSR